ncbi:MAG: phage tail assembly protein [Aliarcobacter butzleri]|uniref:phage tail assembly protein n=1 Tax=Aliarcobacter butzleri TaxID=28197 RepID=UPI00263F2028|nr:phage tail assembly protein [Aliarcobacter butzleri]MDN5092720.1 phage tail assembly protein [Aliarcobacter butzleri]MDY0193733.1 phage tail assembly protein [Aliarcobacter butzleri]
MDKKKENQTKAVIPLPPFKEIDLPYAGKTVKMRKPIVRDIKALANITNQEIKTYHLISNLTGLSMDEIEMLDYPDFSVLNKELESFL